MSQSKPRLQTCQYKGETICFWSNNFKQLLEEKKYVTNLKNIPHDLIGNLTPNCDKPLLKVDVTKPGYETRTEIISYHKIDEIMNNGNLIKKIEFQPIWTPTPFLNAIRF